VIPSTSYIRSEEEMMLETFGDAYREYRTPCDARARWVAGDA